MRIPESIIKRAQRRAPDFVIGGHESPYLRRWWLIPRNRFFNIYLHQFLRSDDDRALHTHPWLFNASLLLRGSYREWSAAGAVERVAGAFKFRWGPAAHRVELLQDPFAEVEHPLPCWTLFITGPVVRQWGFLCPKGFVHWKEFTDARDAGAIGKGCEQ